MDSAKIRQTFREKAEQYEKYESSVNIFLAAVSAVFLLNDFLTIIPLPFDGSWIAVIFCGIPIMIRAVAGLIADLDIRSDVLVAVALIASVFIGEIFAAGEIACIMAVGELLEDLTVSKAHAGIEKMIRLTPQKARIVSGNACENGNNNKNNENGNKNKNDNNINSDKNSRNDSIGYDAETIIPAEDVKAGDRLRVLPGEMIPVDGIILRGETTVDRSVLTGESLSEVKVPGDHVFSGTVNLFGTFEMEAEKAGKDSTVQRMIRLVGSADAGKSDTVRLTDRWASWLVIASFSFAVLTGLITRDITRAVAVLVVFCPCSFILSAPTAVMAAIGNASGHGYLISDGGALERLSSVRTAVFDKTGTLTRGVPEVVLVRSVSEYSPDEVHELASSAEKFSGHPFAGAIIRSFGKTPSSPESFSMIPGKGVRASVSGKTVCVGNDAFMSENNIPVREDILSEAAFRFSEACTVIHIAVDGIHAGFLVLSDTLRDDCPSVIRRLRNLGIRPVMMTSDRQEAADIISEQAGISDVFAGCLPEDKLNYIAGLQRSGEKVCMIGDGINDAPALRRADAGIAMGGIGSDIAIENADIVLTNDNISGFPHLVGLSKRMMKTIRFNIVFSLILNIAAVILAASGLLTPVTGALVHNAGSLFVILNSALLLAWRPE